MKTTLELDDRILARAKRAAAEQGITLRALVEDALRARPVAAYPYRFAPPIVRGASPPRVDIADRQALYDILEDRDFARFEGITVQRLAARE